MLGMWLFGVIIAIACYICNDPNDIGPEEAALLLKYKNEEQESLIKKDKDGNEAENNEEINEDDK